MSMNRRNVLLGLGTAAVGSGAMFGSGAFTTFEAERNFNITVANDDTALVGLDANDDLDVVTNEGSTGGGENELDVDLQDVNKGSTLELGNPDDPGEEEAFMLSNNGDTDIEVTVDGPNGVDFKVEDAYTDPEVDGDDLTTGTALEVDASAEVAIRATIGNSDLDSDMVLTAEPTDALE